VPLAKFIEYGQWFQRQAVPNLDRRQVSRIEVDGKSFRLSLADGSVTSAKRVVVAAGIASFAHRPEVFKDLPASLVSHSAEHRDLGKWQGKKVLVLGAGQSALESAVLLHEAGGRVEVLVRAPAVRWLHQKQWLHTWPIEPLLYAPPDVGSAFISHLVARPNLFRQFPRKWQNDWGVSSIRPAGARWLQARFNGIKILTGCRIAAAREQGPQVGVQLHDGTERIVDHVLLGTGYRINIARYPFLPASMLSSIACINGFPQLDSGFESTVPGLHFVGAPAAWSFGPLMRFVAGVEFASRGLFRRVKSTSNGSTTG
jgi:cation diffusion facilitator CzcD-associated flavoprotein CzcO